MVKAGIHFRRLLSQTKANKTLSKQTNQVAVINRFYNFQHFVISVPDTLSKPPHCYSALATPALVINYTNTVAEFNKYNTQVLDSD